MPEWNDELQKRLQQFTPDQLHRSLATTRSWRRRRRGRPIGGKAHELVVEIYRVEFARRGLKML